MNQEKWYQKSVTVIILLIFFGPVGLFLMWKYKKEWKTWVKTVITIIIVLLFIRNTLNAIDIINTINAGQMFGISLF